MGRCYDAVGDPTAVRSLDASGNVLSTQTATYDGDGDLLSSTDARDDTTTYSYRATGPPAQEVQPVA